jgi:hypothetical protein
MTKGAARAFAERLVRAGRTHASTPTWHDVKVPGEADLKVVDGAEVGRWIGARLDGFGGKVRNQVPDGYDAYARVFHRVTDGEGNPTTWAQVAGALGRTAHRQMQWHKVVGAHDPPQMLGSEWSGSRPSLGLMDGATLSALCRILEDHTDEREVCFFGLSTIIGGVWEAHPEAVELSLPQRGFVVLAGPLSAVGRVGFESGEYPVTEVYRDGHRERRLVPSQWQARAPNLIWPADRSWLVHSEVDFDSTLVGGTRELIDALIAAPDLETWEVGRGDSLEAWADKIN